MKKLHDKQWFIDRIGKVIYRDENKCCNTCELIAKNGLEIEDENHADYLYNIQLEFAQEGHYLNYRDEK